MARAPVPTVHVLSHSSSHIWEGTHIRCQASSHERCSAPLVLLKSFEKSSNCKTFLLCAGSAQRAAGVLGILDGPAHATFCSHACSERERERRLEAKDAHGGKRSKLTRDRDRDISEKVALGQVRGRLHLRGTPALWTSSVLPWVHMSGSSPTSG